MAAAAAPKPKAPKVAKVAAAPKPVTRWESPEGLSYFRNEDGQLWEIELGEDGSETVGDWAGVSNAATGEIDSSAKAPATKPTVA